MNCYIVIDDLLFNKSLLNHVFDINIMTSNDVNDLIKFTQRSKITTIELNTLKRIYANLIFTKNADLLLNEFIQRLIRSENL